MVLKVKFIPEVLLSAPRLSPAVPNSTGEKALFTVSTYSFEAHMKTSQIKLLDIESGESSVLIDDPKCSEPTWITNTDFVYLKSSEKGSVSLMVDHIKPGGATQTIRTFDGAIRNLKVKTLATGVIALACSALATPDGKLANPETETRPHSTAKVYTSLFVRHWDSWTTDKKNALWYGVLAKKPGATEWTLSPGETLVNALAGTNLESPLPSLNSIWDFDIGLAGLAFVARDPTVSPAIYTMSDVYFMPLTFTESRAPKPHKIATPGLVGYAGVPVFSHCGKKLAFTKKKDKQDWNAKPRLMLLPDVTSLASSNSAYSAAEFYATADGEGRWDARPADILWAADDVHLFVTAEHRGRNRVFTLPSDPARAQRLPALVATAEGSVVDMRLLPTSDPSREGALFVSGTSMIDNRWYSIASDLDMAGSGMTGTLIPPRVISSASGNGRSFGLSRSQISDMNFDGGGPNKDHKVHAWVVKPSDFDPSKKYPLCMLIHGGPQRAWLDSWSTRLNPAVFAEQGYVVVLPNPTGSTGYGMELQDGVTGNWGGQPYQDIVRCFEEVERTMPFVDIDKAVAVGLSFGGYMINWIQGHDLGRKFRALVCHDGVFSNLALWSTDELFYPIHEFGGTLEHREGYEKWDSSRHVQNWSTPQMIIHSSLDYRIPISEGLAAFNCLQARGVPSKLLVFPDENHMVEKPENSLVWHNEVFDWINKWAGADKSVDVLEAKTDSLRI